MDLDKLFKRPAEKLLGNPAAAQYVTEFWAAKKAKTERSSRNSTQQPARTESDQPAGDRPLTNDSASQRVRRP
ncbi:MAG: hypothetical protein NDJ94_12995 [Vicinamibacteria bacterium]|nr:hypothetical protein [Vicinamibacteria bacterium]